MKKIVVLLLVMVTIILFGCQQTQQGSKCVTLEVVYEAEGISETIEACTDEEYLLGVLEENAEELGLETTEASFGVYVAGLVDYNFEALGMGYYWSIFVNDEYGMLGVSDQPVVDGDVFKFEAASF